MNLAILAALPLLDPTLLVRVDQPDFPGALTTGAQSSVLEVPPTDGTRWRYEPIPELDRWTDEVLLDVTNADLWQRRGLTGKGVKVAIFDIGWYAPEADPSEAGEVTTHDCWVSPSCADPIDPQRPRLSHEVGIHGYGCADVIRDIAPGVELHLVRTSSLTGFENAVAWAIREEIDLISMSMSFYNDSFYDGGPSVFDRALRNLEAHDILLVSSAGNNATAHWGGGWEDGDGDGRLDFGGDNRLELVLKEGTRSVYVNWNQHARCGDTDLDASLVGPDGEVVGFSRDRQVADGESCQPIERIRADLSLGGSYFLEVVHHGGGVADLRVDVITPDGNVAHPVTAGSLADPSSHPLTFAVGAVRAVGYLDNEPESFSSQGPNNAGQPKPDIAGPDGLTVAAYGTRGFFGTSASTPAVAALIALILEEDPSLTPREAAWRLRGWAWGDDPLGDDPRWGSGKARLPVRDAGAADCGRRPLIAALFLLPWGWFRRRRR